MGQRNLTGLLLGAGASYDVAMPLVSDITAELKAFLHGDALHKLNESWRAQGGGHHDDAINSLAGILARPDVHYESVLGFLETQFRRTSPIRNDYHGLYSWLVETVYWILYLRHIRSAGLIEKNLQYLDGIAGLSAANAPLWIFSLNHDLICECLAARHGIPVNSGYTADRLSLPRRDKSGKKTGDLQAETITAEALEKTGLPFLQPGKTAAIS